MCNSVDDMLCARCHAALLSVQEHPERAWWAVEMCKTITDSAAFEQCRDMPINIDEYYNDCVFDACKYDVISQTTSNNRKRRFKPAYAFIHVLELDFMSYILHCVT